MEKNWIEEIKEFISKAMNKGLYIEAYYDIKNQRSHYTITVDNISFRIYNNELQLTTPKGYMEKTLDLTKRDLLELDAMLLSIEEYNEDIALMEFNNFFKEEDTKIVNINDLDSEDE